MLYQDFAKRLRARRESLGLSQEVFESKGISQQKLSQWEISGTKNFKLEDLKALGEIMQCSLDYLIYGHKYTEIVNTAIISGIQEEDLNTIIEIFKKYSASSQSSK